MEANIGTKRHLGVATIILGLISFGCQPPTKEAAPAFDAYKKGQFTDAYQSLEREPSEPILKQLDLAMAALGDAKTAESREHFEDGLRLVDAQSGADVIGGAAAFFGGDGVSPYLSAPYESIASRIFWALSYLLGGEEDRLENVSAACRDLDGAMEKIEALYEHVYEYDAAGEPSDFNFRVPPIGKYLGALAAHYRGESDNASIYMKQAAEGLGQNSFIEQEMAWMETGEKKGRVIVLALLGLAPKKIESTDQDVNEVFDGVNAVFQASKGSSINRNHIGRIRIATLEPASTSSFDGIKVAALDGGSEAMTTTIADFDAYAREQMTTIEDGMVFGAAFRAAVRAVAAESVEHNTGIPGIGSALSKATSTVESVDLRSWKTLPREVHAAAFSVEGDSTTVVLNGNGINGVKVPLVNLGDEPAVIIILQPSKGAKAAILVSQSNRPQQGVEEASKDPVTDTTTGLEDSASRPADGEGR